MKLESLLQYLDEYLEVEDFPDYGSAHNGLQVEGPTEVERVAVAVDASEAVILEAVDQGVDLLIVHHGLFWDGRTRVTGPRFRKLRSLIQGSTALYGCHLPLEEGNRCSVCHRGNPHDNVFARPPPPVALDPSTGRLRPIVAGESCFPCHIDSVRLGIAPRITHPFNTVSPFECIQCHKPT